ncbi:hypothetical protein [Phaeacidiphilus oryzae]|uniref:hypothetical protein n=1 Tax=Phaeacidiphilus oryzae TaxID=348818 RepID=UPI00126A08CD|nr:hypothetical protein [Phaeacidiphilus oryzae]
MREPVRSREYSPAPSSRSREAEASERRTRYANAAMTAAPLAGQGAAMIGAGATGNSDSSLRGYGASVAATGVVSGYEAAQQVRYAYNVRQNPQTTQPDFTPARFVGATAGAVGGMVYGATRPPATRTAREPAPLCRPRAWR